MCEFVNVCVFINIKYFNKVLHFFDEDFPIFIKGLFVNSIKGQFGINQTK